MKITINHTDIEYVREAIDIDPANPSRDLCLNVPKKVWVMGTDKNGNKVRVDILPLLDERDVIAEIN